MVQFGSGRRGIIPFESHKFRVISPRAHLTNLGKCSITVAYNCSKSVAKAFEKV